MQSFSSTRQLQYSETTFFPWKPCRGWGNEYTDWIIRQCSPAKLHPQQKQKHHNKPPTWLESTVIIYDLGTTSFVTWRECLLTKLPHVTKVHAHSKLELHSYLDLIWALAAFTSSCTYSGHSVAVLQICCYAPVNIRTIVCCLVV